MNILRNERGQILPFVAVSILIMLLFAAFSIGLSKVYLDRMNIRDAADAAASAALSVTEFKIEPTYYGEKKKPRCVERDSEGNCIKKEYYWVKTTGGEQPYVVLDKSQAEASARAYFQKNMSLDGADYKIKDWDIDVEYENRKLQVAYKRPRTEGRNYVTEKNFPRYVTVRLTLKVETPVPLGNIADKEKVVTGFSTLHYRELK